jgi:hypothetical protein
LGSPLPASIAVAYAWGAPMMRERLVIKLATEPRLVGPLMPMSAYGSIDLDH